MKRMEWKLDGSKISVTTENFCLELRVTGLKDDGYKFVCDVFWGIKDKAFQHYERFYLVANEIESAKESALKNAVRCIDRDIHRSLKIRAAFIEGVDVDRLVTGEDLDPCDIDKDEEMRVEQPLRYKTKQMLGAFPDNPNCKK